MKLVSLLGNCFLTTTPEETKVIYQALCDFIELAKEALPYAQAQAQAHLAESIARAEIMLITLEDSSDGWESK